MTPREKRLIRCFNLTEVLWQKVFDYEKGICPLCGRPLTKPNTDHCHKTGLVRGILCSHCNRALGYVKDSIPWLLRAIEYLEHPPATSALGGPHFGLPGRVDTKKQRKLYKKLQKQKCK